MGLFSDTLDSQNHQPPSLADALYADMQRRDVGVTLFFNMLRLSHSAPEKLRDAATQGPQVLSRSLLTDMIGLDATAFHTTRYSAKSLGDFYELLLQLQQGLPDPALRRLRWDARLFQDRKLADVSRLIHPLFREGG